MSKGQANRWIRNMEKENSLEVVKLSQSDFVRRIEGCVQYGRPVLLENVGETIDSILEPVLTRQTYKSGNTLMMKIGDSAVEYSPQFKFYVTTKLPSPHYTPEISTKVVLINFTITPQGLEDQLLGITVETERADLEEERQKLVVQNAGFKKQIAEIEDKILKMLSEAGGDILEDEELINTLSASKVTSSEIMTALEAAERTENTINEARMLYKPYAERGSLLFFCVADLRSIEPMYQYSLGWFVNLFVAAMHDSSSSDDIAARVQVLIDFFTYSLYRNVCRSLFEKDKLLYSFLVCSKLMIWQQLISTAELKFLLSGVAGPAGANPPPKPAEWFPDRAWTEILQATLLEQFKELGKEFVLHVDDWKQIYDSADPARMKFPGVMHKKYSSFQKLTILRCLRPDKIVQEVQNLVVEEMGQKFVEPPPFDLQNCFDDSSPTSPLIFVLSPGADPNASLIQFADSVGIKLDMLSLGQGQGPIAERMIEDAVDRGSWVVLQNCHLSPSWMPALEAKVEKLSPERCHAQFRLWLTSYPSDKFPVAILQNGVKMTLQPPKGLRANMLNTYFVIEDSFFEGCSKVAQLRKLHFSLAFFHASLQERRKFGPLGFNIPYEFTESDLRICQTQVKMFLEEFEQIPWAALRYTAGETNYGGRVTDAHDRTTVNTMLELLYTPRVLDEDYKFSESGIYFAPPDGTVEDHKQFLRNLPLVEAPECFGLHENANITFATAETYSLFDSLLLLMPKGGGGGGGKSADSTLETMALEMLERLPERSDFYKFGLPWNVEDVQEKYPTLYTDSMNTVLTQELLRFNVVIDNVRSSLQQLLNAVKGIVLMSSDLERMSVSFLNGSIPSLWSSKCYPSLKPLGPFYDDFLRRLHFFQTWINNGAPCVFWLSGFYFTQSFLTGTLQNFARKHKKAIDTLSWSFQVMREAEEELDRPEDGCYIHGLFLDGAGWDPQQNHLAEQQPKILFIPMPIVLFKPCETKDIEKSSNEYTCPIYKTSARRGTLSTTGHSTNFVMDIVLPSPRDASHWILRGVACLCQLDF
ncbi:hypothetical protein GUITHDRAFT_83101 [Guillardia theta CCMP2712]|uniref:Dynein heavy chain n=1 Tax=Guillardia theta (strain CCMP2712) TaxID=905079 RepID=L1I5W3_GUITC|nr:hypothetical protein GUITHDRAFT_83101 [Guillardia theta CCMP2712]EKX31472.1 hypothetical protein GUITHDRAFT_83101 [Guillardia theta CCMP2712]|eukprot:XP_005818452.1 hypothetical protein GUITHDRAFT_83101 [Guillardia theta CCMP2712]